VNTAKHDKKKESQKQNDAEDNAKLKSLLKIEERSKGKQYNSNKKSEGRIHIIS